MGAGALTGTVSCQERPFAAYMLAYMLAYGGEDNLRASDA
jgi:hypothetical protein